MYVAVQEGDFNAGALIDRLCRASGSVGAVVSMVGLVRDLNEGQAVSVLTLEHYPQMTQAQLEAIGQRASERWGLLDWAIVHRVGRLAPSDQIVFVGAASVHREQAFEACHFMMDRLKTEATIWKKEQREGVDVWLEARRSDQGALSRWVE